MKPLFKIWKAVLLLALSMCAVSCQEFIDSIFGSSVDNPVSSVPTTESGTDNSDNTNTLNLQVADLEKRIAILELNNMDVTTQKNEIGNLKSEIAMAASMTNPYEKQKEIQMMIDALAESIKKISSTMIHSVAIYLTLNSVVNETNQLGFNPNILATYVGKNHSGMEKFPVTSSNYNVDPNGSLLAINEISAVQTVNGGMGSYLLNNKGNAGIVYFSITPRKVAPIYLNLSLIESSGEAALVDLDNTSKSDNLVTWDEVKHKIYLYETRATINLNTIEQYINKNLNDCIWDAGSELTGSTQVADSEAPNMFGRYLHLANQVKTNTIESVIQNSLKILQDFYNGAYLQRNGLRYQALKVSWDDGENDVISKFKLASVVFIPLNFKQMFLLDNFSMPWSFKNFEGAFGDLVKTIQDNTSGVSSVTLKSVSMDSSQPKMTITAGDADIIINISEELNNAINNGLELASLEKKVNAILQKYQTAGSSNSNIISRVIEYLDANAANDMRVKGGNVAWNGVEPILLFENSAGLTQLFPNMTINGSGATTFIMTSMTDEYIVPSYMKYIAIIQNGAVVNSYLYEGKEKIAQLSLPIGESEIVYQVSDYYGNVVTKRYPVKREQ